MNTKTKTADTTQKVGQFEFDMGLPVPAMTRGGGGGANSELAAKLNAMPVGASFHEKVDEPDAKITDPVERDKVFKENTRKVANRFSGAIRRHKSKTNANAVFVTRVVGDDDKDGKGVRLFRQPDAEPKAGAAS